MDTHQLIQWAFEGILGLCCVQGIKVLSQMRDSIEKLNEKMATLLERTDWHERELNRLDVRLGTLEQGLIKVKLKAKEEG